MKPIIYPGCNKAYPFYVVDLTTGTVVSGWEFRSDAEDDLAERVAPLKLIVWSADVLAWHLTRAEWWAPLDYWKLEGLS